MYCLSCGKKITKNSKFCKYCGSPQRKQKTSFFKVFLITGILFLILIAVLIIYINFEEKEANRQKLNWELVLPTSSITPTETPVKVKNDVSVNKIVSDTGKDNEPWGVAKQVDEHTWTMKVGSDPVMATRDEILSALNEYRSKNGSQKLTVDSQLTAYAQTRADYFAANGLDGHKGFNDFLDNQDGFKKLGFNWLGENASYGYKLNGVHLIEWVYGGDDPHDKNQLDTRWDHVGIGIRGTSTCIIFGTGKM